MLNLPECDYCTLDELCEISSVESKNNIKRAIEELVSKSFVVKVDNKYAINKTTVVGMQIL